jgi:hypothetical protein
VVAPWQVACRLGSALCLCSVYRSRGYWGGQIVMGSLLAVVITNFDPNPLQDIEAEQIDEPSGTKMSIEQGRLTPQARSGLAARGHEIKSGKEHQGEYAKLPRLRARSREQARSCRGPAALPSRASFPRVRLELGAIKSLRVLRLSGGAVSRVGPAFLTRRVFQFRE